MVKKFNGNCPSSFIIQNFGRDLKSIYDINLNMLIKI